MINPTDPYHAHLYYDEHEWGAAEQLHQELTRMLATGALPNIVPMLEATGLTALVHPVTDDDLADHTTLATWIGEPLPLDQSVLDPPGHNQAIGRFGKVDF